MLTASLQLLALRHATLHYNMLHYVVHAEREEPNYPYPFVLFPGIVSNCENHIEITVPETTTEQVPKRLLVPPRVHGLFHSSVMRP